MKNKKEIKILKDFSEKIIKQENTPLELQKLINKNFWKLI